MSDYNHLDKAALDRYLTRDQPESEELEGDDPESEYYGCGESATFEPLERRGATFGQHVGRIRHQRNDMHKQKDRLVKELNEMKARIGPMELMIERLDAALEFNLKELMKAQDACGHDWMAHVALSGQLVSDLQCARCGLQKPRP